MSEKNNPQSGPSQPPAYAIRIKGHIDTQWAHRFGNVTITLLENGDTLLFCTDLDQAALHGLLTRIRDLGVTLLSVNPSAPKPDDLPDARC